jgi:dTDP-4-dehydrorhamnose 3,5-epimerase
MGAVSLDDIQVTPLKRIPTPGGDVMHAVKRTDSGFVGFGEAYFSWVDPGAVKAWKRHQRLTLNLVVPIGLVRFVFHVADCPGKFRVEEIGVDRYSRVTAPPGIWFGLQGLAAPQNLVLNVTDLPHDPAEVQRRSVSEIAFNW